MEATHFIEQYNDPALGELDYSFTCVGPLEIEYLKGCLDSTKEIGLKTVAIFRIRYKDGKGSDRNNVAV